jgi:hypothetical protein
VADEDEDGDEEEEEVAQDHHERCARRCMASRCTTICPATLMMTRTARAIHMKTLIWMIHMDPETLTRVIHMKTLTCQMMCTVGHPGHEVCTAEGQEACVVDVDVDVDVGVGVGVLRGPNGSHGDRGPSSWIMILR